jgi:hypothetical protein
MSDLRSAAHLALAALTSHNDLLGTMYLKMDAVKALKAALAEPIIKPEIKVDNTEPVAWMVYTQDGKSVCVTDNPADFTGEHRALPLYTVPPRREWRSLSKEQLVVLLETLVMANKSDYEIFQAIDAKLKELNHDWRAKNSTLACIPAVPPV